MNIIEQVNHIDHVVNTALMLIPLWVPLYLGVHILATPKAQPIYEIQEPLELEGYDPWEPQARWDDDQDLWEELDKLIGSVEPEYSEDPQPTVPPEEPGLAVGDRVTAKGKTGIITKLGNGAKVKLHTVKWDDGSSSRVADRNLRVYRT